MRKQLFSLSLVILSLIANSQRPEGAGNRPGGQMPAGRFYGKVVESKSGKPIEYASVQLLQNRLDTATRKRKEVSVAGMITKTNGEFSLENVPPMGTFKLKITVIGYVTYEKEVSFGLKPGGSNTSDMGGMMGALDKDLGNIRVDIAENTMENVTVTASSNPPLKLGIDRKVFSVDKNIVTTGGTAVDVMRNVPSVNVDLDGNVTMRNNSPQIFVDGRPTSMELDQIPADIIDNIEIITNPSAKFDASGGTAGIINVVLKKNKKVGYNGNLRKSLDSRWQIGLGADLNLRQNKINFFINGNYRQNKSISTGNTDRITYGTPNSQLIQDDRSEFLGLFRSLRTGFDYFINNRNTLSVSGRIGDGNMSPVTTSDMETLVSGTSVTRSLAKRNSDNENKFRSNEWQLAYKHIFPKSGQELTADVTYNNSRSNSTNLIKTDSLDFNTKNILKSSSQRQDGTGSRDNLTLQLDYVNPISQKSKLELGARARFQDVDNRNDFFFIASNGNAIFNPQASVNFNSTDRVYAAYSTFTSQIKRFGYQLGLRAESSNYEGRLPDKNQVFMIKFPVSLFPSVFLSNKMDNEQELQLNYSRRINRPNFYQLYPFTDYSDSLNINRGNPDLNPEFTNSFELSYQKTFKKNKDSFLGSLYYKNTNDLITRFQVKEFSPLTGNDVLVNTYINAASSYITGMELTLKTKMTKWWDLISNVNLFTSKINTGIAGQPEQDPFVSWFGKLNNTMKLAKNLTMQLSGEYQSRTVLPPSGSGGGTRGGHSGGGGWGGMFGQATSAQGFVRANYFIDAGMRYEFMKNRQASVSLNINDILRTRRTDIFSESPFFVQNVFRRRDPQILRINFSWRFGKFDANLFKRKNNRSPDGGDMEGMRP